MDESTELLCPALDNPEETHLELLDIFNIFHRVWRKSLLSSSGFNRPLEIYKACFLNKQTIAVQVDGVLSQRFSVAAGTTPTLPLFTSDLTSASNPFHWFYR